MTIWPEFYRELPSEGVQAERELLAEPKLDELLDDPVLQTLMRRDGVTRFEILSLVRRFQAHRGKVGGTPRPPRSASRERAAERCRD